MEVSKELESKGFVNRVLRDHQVKGVEWLTECYDSQNGAILADDMGLGKTTQTIALALLKESSTPSLVISPLSVLDNWVTEFNTFVPNLKTLKYRGTASEREALRTQKFNVLLTTYEMCLKDAIWIQSVTWNLLVVDEGHRLKNSKSQLSIALSDTPTQFRLILSGTPVQNNISELYSLLNFIDRTSFPLDDMTDFSKRYSEKEHTDELHELLRPFLLRRTKSQVLPDLPSYQETLLYCGLTELQKKYYKACLVKDYQVINTTLNKTSMNNIVMQLRKCSNHPYMFSGAEPEPFILGEHLIEASGKLQLLDRILNYCQANQHKVLIFSQFKLTLDILQDYMFYRKYTYERLDGSVRDEERFVSIKNFASNQIFCFLLSTRAGGVGLNLVAADTIIFFDSDWNPQNDLQAAARAHRIGQSKTVKMFRLVSKHTVEEIMLNRTAEKLKLTERVIAEGGFYNKGVPDLKPEDMSDLLMFGLEKLFGDSEISDKDVDMETILGKTTEEGMWVVSKSETKVDTPVADIDYYDFEGENYRVDSITRKKNIDTFNAIVAEQMVEDEVNGVSSSRKQSNTTVSKLRPVLTAEQIAEKAKKYAARMKAHEENKKAQNLARVAQRAQKLQDKRDEIGYVSTAVELNDTDDEADEADEVDDKDIEYVVGDATKPSPSGLNLTITCVDDSGEWGRGGMFTAISKQTNAVADSYELAEDMGDLKLGQCHVMDFVGDNKVALLVCIKWVDQHISYCKKSLTMGLKALSQYALTHSANVHLPRIAAGDWYSTERMLRKYLTARNIDTFVYYFRRHVTTRDDDDPGPSGVNRVNRVNSSNGLTISDSEDESRPKGKRSLTGKRESQSKRSRHEISESESSDEELEAVESDFEDEEDGSDWQSDPSNESEVEEDGHESDLEEVTKETHKERSQRASMKEEGKSKIKKSLLEISDSDQTDQEDEDQDKMKAVPKIEKPTLTISDSDDSEAEASTSHQTNQLTISDSDSESENQPSKLGHCFKGMTFFISPDHSKAVTAVLQRYIIGYGGEIVSFVSQYTTHFVEKIGQSKKYSEYRKLKCVYPQWISEKVRKPKL